MKKLIQLSFLTAVMYLTGCTKEVTDPLANVITSTQTEIGTGYILVKELDSTELTIEISPAITCYTYKYGQPLNPCDIRIYFNCNLTKPVNGWLRIDIRKKTSGLLIGTTNAEISDLPDIVLNIAPRTTNAYFNSFFKNADLNQVPDIFRIDQVIMYKEGK